LIGLTIVEASSKRVNRKKKKWKLHGASNVQNPPYAMFTKKHVQDSSATVLPHSWLHTQCFVYIKFSTIHFVN
jgi:hypothetical protein